jgi:hypothetical protein
LRPQALPEMQHRIPDNEGDKQDLMAENNNL